MAGFKDKCLAIREIGLKSGIYRCVQCGKCTTACPMSEIYLSFTWEIAPRAIIEKVRRGELILEGELIWKCLECGSCSKLCPQGVDFLRFIRGVRAIAVVAGITPKGKKCSQCGKVFITDEGFEYICSRLSRSGLRLDEGIEESLGLCPECRRREFSRRVKNAIKWKVGRKV